MKLIRSILRGTYAGSISDAEQRDTVSIIATDIRFSIDPQFNGDGCPPAAGFICGECGENDEGTTSLAASVLYWRKGTKAFQVSNAQWAHAKCSASISAEALIEGKDISGADQDEDELEE